jgi:hypothetical protein
MNSENNPIGGGVNNTNQNVHGEVNANDINGQQHGAIDAYTHGNLSETIASLELVLKNSVEVCSSTPVLSIELVEQLEQQTQHQMRLIAELKSGLFHTNGNIDNGFSATNNIWQQSQRIHDQGSGFDVDQFSINSMISNGLQLDPESLDQLISQTNEILNYNP